jgi:hypothetical protein
MSKDKKKEPVKKTEVKVDSKEGNAKKNVGTNSNDAKKDKKNKKDQ